jgi:hypothetical protein
MAEPGVQETPSLTSDETLRITPGTNPLLGQDTVSTGPCDVTLDELSLGTDGAETMRVVE